MAAYIRYLTGIMLVAAPVWMLLRVLWRKLQKRQLGEEHLGRELILGLFVLFMTGLLCLALQGHWQAPRRLLQAAAERIHTGERINLIPFSTIGRFAGNTRVDAFAVNIVGNIVMFVPWGFGLPLLWKKYQRASRILLSAAALPLFIETVQLFIGRSVDVDDLILNFAGGCLGGIFYWGCRKLYPEVERLQKV